MHREGDDVIGFAVQRLHIVERGADVLTGDVLAAKLVDEAAHRPHQRLGFVDLGVTDDDCFATTQINASRCVLVGHAAGQSHGVEDGVLLVSVRPHSQPAGGGSERGGVNSDDGAQAGVAVVAHHHLLEFVLLHVVENACVHGCSFDDGVD